MRHSRPFGPPAATIMELKAIWQFLLRRWWLILLPAVAAFILALPGLRGMISPAVSYTVQIRLTAATPPEAEGSTTASAPYEDSVYVPFLASEYLVVNLPAWITSDTFAEEVSTALRAQGHIISADDLRPAFAADSYRSVLVLYVTWDDESDIRLIADSAVKVLQTRSTSYLPQTPASLAVVPWDDVNVNQIAPPLMTRFAPLLRIAVGLAAGVALALLAEYLDGSIHSRRDVEALGMALLGEIPPER
jgi:capsular polysaccharide biosynthesis protein